MLCDLTAGKTQCAAVSAAGAVKVDNSGVTQPISGNVGITGTVAATQSGTWSTRTQDGSGNAIGSTSGAMNVNVTNSNTNGPNTPANSSPVVSAYSTPGNAIAPATPTGVNLKASQGQVSGIQLGTIASGPAYLKLYNSASAPTCGSGTPVARFIIPAAATAANGGGSNITFSQPINFSAGIGYCVTGGITDADTTTLTANTVLVNIDWN
jgi:hypothetical protein